MQFIQNASKLNWDGALAKRGKADCAKRSSGIALMLIGLNVRAVGLTASFTRDSMEWRSAHAKKRNPHKAALAKRIVTSAAKIQHSELAIHASRLAQMGSPGLSSSPITVLLFQLHGSNLQLSRPRPSHH